MIAVDLLCFAQTILLHDTGFAPGGAGEPAYRLLHTAAEPRHLQPDGATGSAAGRAPRLVTVTPQQTRSTIGLKIKLSAALNHEVYLPPAAGMSRSVLNVSFSFSNTPPGSQSHQFRLRVDRPRPAGRRSGGTGRTGGCRTKLMRRPSMA